MDTHGWEKLLESKRGSSLGIHPGTIVSPSWSFVCTVYFPNFGPNAPKIKHVFFCIGGPVWVGGGAISLFRYYFTTSFSYFAMLTYYLETFFSYSTYIYILRPNAFNIFRHCSLYSTYFHITAAFVCFVFYVTTFSHVRSRETQWSQDRCWVHSRHAWRKSPAKSLEKKKQNMSLDDEEGEIMWKPLYYIIYYIILLFILYYVLLCYIITCFIILHCVLLYYIITYVILLYYVLLYDIITCYIICIFIFIFIRIYTVHYIRI